MYYTTKDIREKYNKTKVCIELWLKNGIFPNAYKVSGRWRIPVEDVENVFSDKNDGSKEDMNIIKKRKELVGKTFGALTILEVLGYRQETKAQSRLFVEVGCECGNITEMPFYNIERGAQKYCSNQCPAKSGFEIGQTIYNLTITEDLGVERKEEIKDRGRRIVRTKCRCGKRRDVILRKLKSGSIKSCSRNCQLNLLDIVGQKFGKLTVLKEVDRDEKYKSQRMFLCKCDCGKEITKAMNKLKGGHTKFCGHSCDLKKGVGSASWNPDLSWEDRLKERDYFEYKQWRKDVYTRDDFTCQCCQKVGGIAAHHKDGYHWCIERRIDVNNGVTLCETCHLNFHEEYGYKNNTEEQYIQWINNKKVSV